MAEDFLNDRHKIFYSIGEVSALTGLKSHILRYWESEFPTLILLILAIKKLLYQEGYTIAGARKKLAAARRRPSQDKEMLVELRDDLENLLGVLRADKRKKR
jgi:DNA-binding transcriptional MerR regulator